ncbi:hypothetical protein Scep_011846 [Stephania cephalantha]|uniref:Aspartic peptidase DDI1-type domain-containing protein n=1 Tax=Stephania cephalantha TaxID=152367 RepID=A0AAP0JFW7_9MAGN
MDVRKEKLEPQVVFQIEKKKEKFDEVKTMHAVETYGFALQTQLPKKVEDPGNYRLPCSIKPLQYEKALCDLGAGINLMPLAMLEKLGIAELRPAEFSVHFVDGSMSKLRGVTEDVLVKVDRFMFPCDFVVLDFEKGENVPLKLGRTFLATAQALIDVVSGEITLRVGSESSVLKICKDFQQLKAHQPCHTIKEINTIFPGKEINEKTLEYKKLQEKLSKKANE